MMLFCFAVKEEARPFRRRLGDAAEARILVSGIGRRNAEEALLAVLEGALPAAVITSGFAGGLDPALPNRTVLFEADDHPALAPQLMAAGARSGRFFCADRIAVTVADKQALRRATGADAVEMESAVIRRICRERGIPSATVRVISDAADEDLPLDFNALMSPGSELNYGRLAWSLLKTPAKVAVLLRFQRRLHAAAERLAAVLAAIMPA